MPKILPLSEEIIAKIAAGEVIERPVYAVKELVENSLDAGADRIRILLEDSGLKRITVIDNGEGMSKEDLLECFKSHTTSKISSLDHLHMIKTLGFRGEALASISAIAKVTIKSKTKKSVTGTKIELGNREVLHSSPVGMPVGTEISVIDLFSSLPGRKNFLKSERTEFRHIADWFTAIALSHPQVHFTFSHNNNVLYDLPKTTHLAERIRMLLGTGIYSSLIPFDYCESYVNISGFITKPQTATGTQKHFLFVNHRFVTDKRVAQAAKEAYATLIESSSHPVYILFLNLPYELVDVNVHPRKEEIRFVDNQLVGENVYKAISEALTSNNLTYVPTWENDRNRKFGHTDSYAGIVLKDEQLPWTLQTIPIIKPNQILQIHDLYLLTPTKFGLLIIDQHAAHERILYEQFVETFEKHKTRMATHRLAKSRIIELSFSERETLDEYLHVLENLGFEIEKLKRSTFLIHSIPLIFQDRNIPQLINEIIEELQQDKTTTSLDKISQRMIAYLACRGAVKAGDRLTKEQSKELIERLEKTKNNATCPHGRPTKVEFTLRKLHSMFKRT